MSQTLGNDELHPELAKCVVTLSSGVQKISHPLVTAMLYAPQMNGLHNAMLISKNLALEESIQNKNWKRYISLHEQPYSLDAFKKISHELTDKDYWTFLGKLWADSNSIWQYGELFANLLKSQRDGKQNIMTAKEESFLSSLPDQIAVYRGHHSHNRLGWSWTLSYVKADRFSRSLAIRRRGVVRATVSRNDITAVILRRSEMECIIDPVKVINPVAFVPSRWEMPDILSLATEGAKGLTVLSDHSIHGRTHWHKVDWNVQKLSRMIKVDRQVCRLFAYLHDCKRENEHKDPQHGQRAADYVEELHKLGKLEIDNDQLALLVEAIRDHDKGFTSTNPTIGTCWDADRLDLMRVDEIIDSNYLSTAAAKGMKWKL